jgi:hypothetical protein
MKFRRCGIIGNFTNKTCLTKEKISRSTSASKKCLSILFYYIDKNVGRFHPFIGHEGSVGPFDLGIRMGEGSASRPGRTLPPGETWYQFYGRLSGPQGLSGQVRKISPPRGFDPRTVQPVGSRYTDYARRQLEK